MKRIIPAVITTAALLCSGNLFAAEADEDLLRNLFQRLEVYLGIMQANEREHENLLRSVAPPDAKQSAAAGKQMEALDDLAAINEQILTGATIDWNMLQGPDEANNTTIVTRHIAGYCSAEEQQLGICQYGLTVEEGGAADLLVDTLLANPTLSHLNNAMAFVYMLTNPNPIPLPDDAFQSDDLTAEINVGENTPLEAKLGADTAKMKMRPLTSAGVRTLAARYKQMAMLSTAQFALNSIAAERNPLPNGKSAFEELKTEVERRFNNPLWHNEINKLPDTALLRELLTMQALQLALDFKRYEQEQTLITLVAAQVSANAQSMGTTEAAYQMQ